MPQATLPEDDQQTASASPHDVAAVGRTPRPRSGFGVVVGKRLRRRTRWMLRFLVFLPLISILVAMLLMRSPVVGWVVARQLEAALGCEARVDNSFVMFDGRVVLRGISLRIPGVEGREGEFLRAARAEIDADWSQVLGGTVKPTGVRLYGPLFRLSAGRDDSVLNIQGLHPSNPAAISGDKPVRIDVVTGVVELGEHSAGGYRILREIGVSGALAPSENEPGVYQVRFQERHDPANAKTGVGMMLDGRVDLQSSIAVIRLLNVDLTTWEPTDVPTLLREVWEQLNIKGRIASTSLEYFPTTGVTAVITLDEVSMDAIVPANFAETGPTDDVLSLRQVHGTIKLSPYGLDADVAGLIENQTFPSRVVLKTHDLTTDAALDCKIVSRSFRLDKDPTLLPFCPPIVAARLANFCGPTGVVDADVIIRRAPPGPDGPAPFKIAGWMNFEHGVAAFDRVPYPFTQMSGRVEFDNEAIDILHIEGIGPDGATVSARGRIAPPNHDAEVVIEVNVRNVPLDETFMQSLPPSRAEAIDFLFNRARHRELLDAGLVSEPGSGAPGVPEFALGGRMNVDVVVRSPLGHDAPWTYTADVTIPRAGLLPRAFPLPIAAQNIRLRLTDTDAKLLAGSFSGLNGGSTDVSAEVLLEADGQQVIRPSVTIDAHEVPLDDLLLHAIEYASNGNERSEADSLPSPSSILRTLDLSGNVDCRAVLTSTAEETIDFDIGVVFDELEARPRPDGVDPLVALTNIAGSIQLTNTRMEVPRLTASLRALEGIEAVSSELAVGADLGWIGLSLNGELCGIDTSLTAIASAGDQARSRASLAGLKADIELTGVDLLTPIEGPVAAFAPRVADKIVKIRDARRPGGRVSASVALEKRGAESPLQITAAVTGAENLMFDAAGERFAATIRSGVIKLDSGRTPAAVFEKVQAEIGVDDTPRFVFGLDGAMLLGEAADADPNARLRISGTEIPIESPATSLALRHVLSAENLATITGARPSGSFDATIDIPSTALVDPGADALDGMVATIVPRSLQFDFEGTRVAIDAFEGRLLVGDKGLEIDGLVARADDWTAGINGTWTREADSDGLFDARLQIEADSLTPGIRSLLPAGLRNELDRIELAISGPIRSENAAIRYRADGPSVVTGDLHFTGASLDIGAPLTNADGRLSLLADRAGPASGWSYGLDLEADRLEAVGLEMTDLRAHLDVGKKPGEVILEHLAADCYAGRVSAKARIVDSGVNDAPSASPHGGAFYDAEITMAGVCFAPVLAALESARVRSEGGIPDPMPTELITDPRRGRLDGTLAISGIAGDASHRSGVGSVRIAEGDVVEMPLVLTLVQLSNFQVPSNDRLDFLQTIFHVQENQVVFDQIDLLSSSVAIAGRGTMSWPGQELDLRFNSRAKTRVPIISALFEALRDEIATTRIRGTLSDPRVGPEPLVGTRELIGNIMGDHRGVKRSPGLPDAAAERRRYRGQRPYPPQSAHPGQMPVELLPSTAGVNPDR